MQRLRAIGILTTFLVATLALAPAQWIAVRFDLPQKRTIPIAFHRFLCRLIGINVQVFGAPVRGEGVLVAANHTSYLDILILSAVAPVSFVAKSEVATWPFFGLLARLQRTVFVSRDRRSATAGDRDRIHARLADGEMLVLFPEGTSSDGNRVLAFKSALLSAAQLDITEAGGERRRVLVQPVSVAFTGLHGLPMGRANRPFYAWYGDMDLVPHLWEAFHRGPIDVAVQFHAPVTIDDFPTRKELTAHVQAVVAEGVVNALAGRPGLEVVTEPGSDALPEGAPEPA